MKKIQSLLFVLLTFLGANAATYTSVMDGVYDDPATWGGAGFPSTNDDVFISHAVITTGSEIARDFTLVGSGSLALGGTFTVYGVGTISTGTTFDLVSKRGKFRGDVINNGSVIGSSTSAGFYLQNVGNLSGNGTWDFPGNVYFSRDLEILSGSNLTILQAKLRVSDTVTNNGTINVFNLRGTGTTAAWINNSDATFRIGGEITGDIALTANAVDNVVEYNAMGSIDQNILTPVLGRYYYLVIDGDDLTSIKSLTGNINILGDLEILGSTLKAGLVSANDIDIKGNWYNDGGVFEPLQGFVAFNGSFDQEIDNGNGVEYFYDLFFSGGGDILLYTDLIVQRNITIGKTFDVGGQNMAVGGNWTATHPVLLGGSHVTFNGNLSATITGDINFGDITIDKTLGNALTINTSTNIGVEGTLNVVQGSLNTNNNLTIISNASLTGRIGQISAGAIVGDVTVQRYSSNSLNGWHLMCSPVQGRTLDDWNDDFITTGYVGSDYPSFDFTSATRYDETISGVDKDNGLVDALNSTESISGLTGWRMYIAAGVSNINVKGPLYVGAQNLPVTYTDNGMPLEDGWNLVSNPYASTIDWDAAAGWTRTGMNDAIYVWDPVTEQYTTFIAGVGTNGGSRYIPSTQAFWVQAASAGPSLTIDEPAKVANVEQFRNNEVRNDYFKVVIANDQGLKNDVAIRINEKATLGFDGALDALFLGSPNTLIPAISVKDNDQIAYSVYSIGELQEETIIPLSITVGAAQQYVFSFENVDNFKKSSCMQLIDTDTNEEVACSNNGTYRVFLQEGSYDGRFVLRLSTPLSAQVINANCTSGNDKIEVVVPEGNDWIITAYDTNNNVVFSQMSQGGVLESEALAAGDYSVEIVSSLEQCSGDAFSVWVPTKHNPSINFESIPAILGEDGSVFATVTGALAPYTFAWNNGGETKDLVNVAAGNYSLTVTDSRNCSYSSNVAVYQSDSNTMHKSIDREDVTVSKEGNDMVLFFNLNMEQSYKMHVYNTIGQVVYADVINNVLNENRSFDASEFRGVLLVVLENTITNEMIVKRVSF